MSLLESKESPQSDGKMDISETASLDSTGASSNGNCNDVNEKPPLNFTISEESNYNYNNEDTLINEMDLNESDETSLDSRFIHNNMECSKVTTSGRYTTRTLTYNHPLMLSPKLTDSESEFDQNNYQNINEDKLENENLNENIVLNNYPDVVPKNKYVHIELMCSQNDNRYAKISPSFSPTQLPKEKSLKSVNVFRESNPDLLSNGSELNVSQYQAIVDANLQAVALAPNTESYRCNTQEKGHSLNKNLKFKSMRHIRNEDINSLDSISNHSFDGDDMEHNLASLSPSSSLIDGLDEDGEEDLDDDDDYEGLQILPNGVTSNDMLDTITSLPSQNVNDSITSSAALNINELKSTQLPQYSATEERKDSRNWQKINLPDGTIRDIDMRVIEPYKRVLSHGGYLKAGGHNAIVMFCACHLPDRSRTDYNYVMDNLFLYVVKTLNQLVTDDYVLIYLHGGSSRRNTPPFSWLKKYYQLLDHRLRKSLKNFYLVHPTFWIKSLIWMARPFVSNKFWRKLVYVKSLDELSIYITPLEKAAIPEKVKQYDAKRC